MKDRSIWELLRPIHQYHEIWRRYLLLLARGLGPRIEENSGIVELWPSQIRALKTGLFDRGASSMVRMPTSAGKTRIAEMAIVNHLVSFPGERCVYIAPFKALAGELESSLSGLFSDLGFRLSTTLGSFETDEAEQELLSVADVIISTPEKLDLLLRLRREFFDSVGLIVIDEGQLVEDETRGAHFELLLTRIRKGWPWIRFISLSAVIPQTTLESFARWLGSDQATITRSDWRPAVQRLAQFVWQGDRGFLRFISDQGVASIEEFVPNIAQAERFSFINPDTGRRNSPRFPDTLVKSQTAAELAYVLAPTGAVLVFCPTRRIAEAVSKAMMKRLDLSRQAGHLIHPEFSERETRSHSVCTDWLGDDHPLTEKLKHGIAVHHGGVPNAVKKAIERDFRENKFHVIIATSTLAQGVNLPIKTIIMHSSSRHDGEVNVPLMAREYWNIAGRAGRAGQETEGLIIHICNNDADSRSLRSYAARKNDLEPLQSALLKALSRSVDVRIYNESAFHYLDSDLLALLVEEDVDEVTDEWVSQVFGTTLSAMEASGESTNVAPIIQSFGDLFKSVIQRVPDSQERIDFATTGLRIDSCRSMTEHIRQNADKLRLLLPSAALSDRRQLIDVFLEGCFLAEEIGPKDEPVFEVAEMAELWLSGESYSTLRRTFYVADDNPESLSSFIEDIFGYRLPWGISSYLRLASKELNFDENELPEVVRFFSSMIKYGVPTPYAVWAITLGVNYRTVAIQLGQAYSTNHSSSTFAEFVHWASQWTVQGLRTVFNLRGQELEDVAVTLKQATPSPLIKQSANNAATIFPLRAQVVIVDKMALIAADSLIAGNVVDLYRDYDMLFDRNAVACQFEEEYLGMVDNNVAQLLAPIMDTGSRYTATVSELLQEGSSTRLSVLVSEIVNA